MTRSGYLPRAQGRAVHLTSGLDLVCSGQYLIIRYFPHPVRGHLKPHIYLLSLSFSRNLQYFRHCRGHDADGGADADT